MKNDISTKKNTVIVMPCDFGICGNIRLLDNVRILQSRFFDGNFLPLVTPRPIFDDNILVTTRTIIIQRAYTPQMMSIVAKYKDLQEKYGYKIVYDIDDLLFDVDENYKFPIYLPAYDIYGDNKQGRTALEIINMCDAVNVSTQSLGEAIRIAGYTGEINHVPNTIPVYLYGMIRKPMRTENLTKPHVLYAGGKSHYKPKFTGDFTKGWIDWITKHVEEESIRFTMFGKELPDFLSHLDGKVNLVGEVNYLDFPNTLRALNADIHIAPLTANYFNACKSNIKMLQAYAVDSAFIGTRFGGIISPYDDALNWTYHDGTFDDIETVYQSLLDKDIYNDTITKQRQYLIDKHMYSESSEAQYRFIMSLCDNSK